MNTLHTFTPKEIPETFDLLVAGGGLAGVMAAIAAAREGSKVVLVEKYGFLGGMATAGLVNPFMSWGENGKWVDANAGLFRTLRKRIFDLGGNRSPNDGSYMEEFMKLALDRMVREYPGIKVIFHALVSDVDCADGIVKSVTISTVSGNIKLRANMYIDATGNADLSTFAGFEYNLGREEDGLCQPMTLCFRLANVDWSRINLDKAQALYKQFRVEGKIKNPREDLLVFHMPYEQIMHLNTTRVVGRNPVDVEDYSEGEFEAREQVYEMFCFMRENVEGMENCQLIMSAPELGIRESRRIVGEYEITEEDIVGTKKFDDRIARGTYEIDIHNPAGSGTYHRRVPDNDYYTVPYRALIPRGASNLLVAGRPISSTHSAHSSFRIMPITSCIGEAAGTAAHFAAVSDSAVRDVDITMVQNTLTDHGALI